MSDIPGRHRFVSYARRGLAAAIPEGTATDGSVVSVTLNVATDKGPRNPPPVNVRLYGPGNVVGLDTRQVIRTEPKPNTTEFEPNYLAVCDFDDSFLPWLFSPEQSHPKLKPWLALVVLDRDTSEIKSDPRRPLPWLQLSAAAAADQLNDLDESWAWAHAQITGSEAEPDDALVGPPEPTLSRVVCPRRLRSSTAYRACLVPAYLAGAQAGRGEPVTAAAGVPAWPEADALRAQTAPVELPVYYTWEFTTSVAGDFETLARRLRPKPLDPEIGGRPMDIAHSGAGLPAPAEGEPGRELALEGILGSPGMVSSDWPSPARELFQQRLEELLEAKPAVAQTVLSPPVYGSEQTGTRTEVPPEDGARPWLRRLNLDPRFRVAAGLGTRVVQELQEQLMASAWDQAGELERINELLRNAQLARAAATAASEKHLSPLPSDALLRVTGPAHGRVRLSREGTPAEERPETDPKRSQTLLGGIADPESVFPHAAVAAPFRKLTRPGGPVGRHFPKDERPTCDLSHQLAQGEVEVPITPAKGGADFDRVGEALDLPPETRPTLDKAADLLPRVTHGFTKVAASAIDGSSFYHDPTAPDTEPQAVAGRPGGEAVRAAQPIGPRVPGDEFDPPLELEPLRRERVRGINRRFKNAATFLLEHLPAPAAPTSPAARAEDNGFLDLACVKSGLIDGGGALDPERTVAREVLPLVPPASPTATDPLRPRASAARFPQPMSEPLKAVDREMLLPGAERIEADSIGIAVTNARVLESYMAGLNHELGRELLWRGLPVDLGATFFRQFWDIRASGPGNGPPNPDIPPIDQWGVEKDLGENATRVGGEGMLVLIVRGELLRRYPTTAIYAVKAVPKVDANGQPVLDDDGAPVPAPGTQELYPEFRGTLDPDLTYIGFGIGIAEARGQGSDLGWFFVLQEQPTAPRFGLDEAPEPKSTGDLPATWADAHWGHPFPWGTDLSQVTHLPVAGPLDGVTRPILDRVGPSARWGADSAQMAAITYQRPMRVALHARTMLADAPDPSLRVTAAARANGFISALAGDGWGIDAAAAADSLERGALTLFITGGDGDRIKLVASAEGTVTTERPGDAQFLTGLPEIGG